jgi:crossover junction endodeoxyribonuclease RuvC
VWQNNDEAQAGMVVFGVDPGLRHMGWGVIRIDGSRLSHIANGTCLSGEGDLAARLLALHTGLCARLEEFRPDAAAIEVTFANRDGAGTVKLGQARGVALLALAQAGLKVGEYAPNTIKKTVVGVGHADKRQVDHMVRMQLPGCKPAGPDAADALAIALCHAFHARAWAA